MIVGPGYFKWKGVLRGLVVLGITKEEGLGMWLRVFSCNNRILRQQQQQGNTNSKSVQEGDKDSLSH